MYTVVQLVHRFVRATMKDINKIWRIAPWYFQKLLFQRIHKYIAKHTNTKIVRTKCITEYYQNCRKGGSLTKHWKKLNAPWKIYNSELEFRPVTLVTGRKVVETSYEVWQQQLLRVRAKNLPEWLLEQLVSSQSLREKLFWFVQILQLRKLDWIEVGLEFVKVIFNQDRFKALVNWATFFDIL